MSISFSAHITDAARDKPKAYKAYYECKNNSECLEHLIKHTKVPEPEPMPAEPDPNQTTLSGGNE